MAKPKKKSIAEQKNKIDKQPVKQISKEEEKRLILSQTK